mgnify:CR=1 FL=1
MSKLNTSYKYLFFYHLEYKLLSSTLLQRSYYGLSNLTRFLSGSWTLFSSFSSSSSSFSFLLVAGWWKNEGSVDLWMPRCANALIKFEKSWPHTTNRPTHQERVIVRTQKRKDKEIPFGHQVFPAFMAAFNCSSFSTDLLDITTITDGRVSRNVAWSPSDTWNTKYMWAISLQKLKEGNQPFPLRPSHRRSYAVPRWHTDRQRHRGLIPSVVLSKSPLGDPYPRDVRWYRRMVHCERCVSRSWPREDQLDEKALPSLPGKKGKECFQCPEESERKGCLPYAWPRYPLLGIWGIRTFLWRSSRCPIAPGKSCCSSITFSPMRKCIWCRK